MKTDYDQVARGLRISIQKLEQMKRLQPERAGELTRRQKELRSKLRQLKAEERAP